MISTVTLNASIDKAYHMEEAIVGGTVMRVAQCHNTAGGKGLNVARVVRLCGEDVLATGLVGGFNGGYLESLLDEDGIDHEFGHIAGETRCCVNILDPAFGSTELLEGGPTVSEEELDAFLAQFARVIERSEVVAISGSVPKGLPGDVYARMVTMVREAGKLVILDTSGVQLGEGILACPTMVKPNAEELEALYRTSLASIDDVVALARQIHEGGVPYVAISLGGDGALLVCDEGVFQATPPRVDVVNTVGCGDSMVAAFAVAFARGMVAPDALAYAVSVATANALSASTGSFDLAVQAEIAPQVQVREL